MQPLQFWKSWPRVYQFIFWCLAVVAMAGTLFFWYSYALYPGSTFEWEHFQLLETAPVALREFQTGLFPFTITADNNLVFESVLGSTLQIDVTAFYFVLFFITISAVVLASVISTLPRFWFLGGMGLFILFLVLLRLEATELFGFTNKIPVGIIVFLYIATGFYFNSFKTEATFQKRVLFFLAITIIVGCVIGFGGQVKDPLLHVAVNCLVPGMILSALFLILVAHEIIASFIWIVSQGSRKNNLRHFLIITFIYLINLGLAYAQNSGYLKWDLWTVDFYFLFFISAVLGLWGYRHREPQFENIFSANPYGVLFYLAMAVITLGSLATFFATANDPASDLFSRFILYTHLGYGIIFLAYIISNFSPMLSQNLAVHKILYKPQTMPFFTFRIMGLIASYAFLSYDTTWNSLLDQSFAGYYNAVGDVYYTQGDQTSAQAYYKQSLRYRQLNHHAHYGLATLYASQLDPLQERVEYAKAIETSATEYAYLNLSDSYDRVHETETGIRALQKGLEKFPDSGPIKNGLGLLYLKLNRIDSALYFFEQARHSNFKDIAITNLLAQSAKINSSFPADSLLQLMGSNQEGPQTNALAMANAQHQTISLTIPKNNSDTVLSVYRAALLGNFFLNQPGKIDTTLLNETVALARRPINSFFKEALLTTAAHAYYAQGETKKAFGLARQLAYLTGGGKYNQLLGMWSLEKNNPLLATEYFEKAQNQKTVDALYGKAVAFTECDSLAKAKTLWQELSFSADSMRAAQATAMLQVLNLPNSQLSDASDEVKYQFLKYRVPLSDSITFWFTVRDIQNQELKVKAILDRSKKWYALDEVQGAIFTLEKAKGLKFADKNLFDEIRHFNLRLVAANKNWETLRAQMELQPFDAMHLHEKEYYEALLYEQAGNRKEATARYQHLLHNDSYFEEACASAVAFLNQDATMQSQTFAALVDALLNRPFSIRLLKAYVLESARLGYEKEADQALEKLRKLVSPQSFNRFIEQNPKIFTIQ